MDEALESASVGPEGRLIAGLGAWLFAAPRSTPAVLLVLLFLAFALVLVRRGLFRSRPPAENLFRLAGRIEMGLLGLLLLGMVLLSALQILLRNAFGFGFLWVDPLLRYATLWIGFIGAAVAAAQGRHIQIDVLSHVLTPRVRRITGRVTSLAAAATCAVLCESAYRYLASEYAYDTREFLRLPSWVLLLVIPVGFAVLTYRFIDRAIMLPPADALVAIEDQGAVGKGAANDPDRPRSSCSSPCSECRSSACSRSIALLAFRGAGIDTAAVIVEMNRLATAPMLIAIPLFTFAGYLFAEAGSPARLVRFSRALLGWFPGGLAIVALVACAVFTAFTGASRA